jgi:acyl carrier protein
MSGAIGGSGLARENDEAAIAAELEAFVRERFEVSADDPAFHRGAHLWDEGYVDSTGTIEVIAFLEERYDLTFPEGVLYDPEFTTIDGMARCVAALLR